MMLSLPEALMLFRQRVIGSQVRSRAVDSVEVIVDDLGGESGGQLRFMLYVHFPDNPLPVELPDEEKLLERVFDSKPQWAQILCEDEDDLMSRLVGAKPCLNEEWVLADELGSRL